MTVQTGSKVAASEHDLLDLYSKVFEWNIEAILITDAEGVIVQANKAACEITGFSADDLIGRSVRTLDTPRSAGARQEMAAQLDSAGAWRGELWLKRSNGSEFPVWQTISRVKDAGGAVSHYIVQFADIASFRETQDELEQKTQDLARSNKELEMFAYVASHDLQEPLRMVASYTQLLARRYRDKLDTEAHEFIDFAVDGANRMQTLINDLLAYSRVGTRGKPFEPVDMNKVMERALVNLRAAVAESGAEITSGTLPTIVADPSQMTQLLQNLIGNAVKFRRPGVTPRVWVSAKRSKKEWLFEVRDNGIGISPEYAKRIFIIFQRLHSRAEYPGTGIGLAICNKIVERHGGAIWLEPRGDAGVEEGASFRFTLRDAARDSSGKSRERTE